MHRFDAIATEVTTLAVTAFSAIVATTAALMPNGSIDTPEGTVFVVIMDNEKMRLICIVGSLGGGVLTTLLSSEKDPSVRGLITKILLSTGTGIIFTPVVVHWWNLSPNTDSLLAVSAMVSMTAVGVLKTIIPLWQKYVSSKFSPPAT